MGFTTQGHETDTVTFNERTDVTAWVHEFADEQDWNYSDVRNRALMYYAAKYKAGELDDPAVQRESSSIEDIGGD